MTPLIPQTSLDALPRLDTLDGIRLISCISIVCYHFFPYIQGPLGELLLWIFRNARVLVDVFFIISGIVISWNYAGKINSRLAYAEFIKRRIARLYPLHLATLLFYSFIGIAVANGYLHVALERKYDFSEWLPNFFMVHAWGLSDKTAFNFPSWSVSAEFFAYLCFPVVYSIVSRSLRAAIVTVALLFAVGILLSEQLVERSLINLTVPWSIFRSVPSFCFGVVLFCYREQLPHFSPKLLSTLFHRCSALLGSALVIIDNGYVLLVAACLFVTLALMADRDGLRTTLSSPILVLSSHLTYSIYMLHALVATVFLSFVFPRVLGGLYSYEWVRIVCIVTGIALTVIAAKLSYRYFEKPMRDALNKVKLQPKPKATVDNARL
jgi:peptidoglycan/LPS O-acetylase OafA/YrhL